MSITASTLYDYIQCPHKVWRDIYGPQEEKIQETNPFVKLLWEKGVKHEEKIVSNLGSFLNLSKGTIDERFQSTLEAMKNRTPLIYQGVLKYENLLGVPDLLKLLPDNAYMPIDIKSGMGFEGADEDGEEGKPKKHYAVYYYSHHEKTTYKKLQKRYPDVISAEHVEQFFENSNVIDLYKLVQKQTDWPIGSYSLKALATYLGFKWRDETPSGALSIQWFNSYLETKDETMLKRILEYNEDDCRATMVLKDKLVELSNS